MKKSNRVIDAYELYYRRNGEKRSVLCNTYQEVLNRRLQLKKNKRKFLGYRKVTLGEV
jgi:hypothetical protein